ncbi:MAG: 7-carboxy-7-deazaguanine synthase QueE, partial [Flavobacteriales bacterium]
MSIVNNNSSSEILQSGTSAANAGYYPVVEIFNTLQGEGHHAGRSACFVRLAGCDVGCRWCDTPGSWKAGHYPPVDATSIKGEASCSDAAIVVVTGGEPAMYDLAPLCDELSKTGKQLHLETCGAYPLTGSWHWICVSPKRNRPPLPANLALADELKVIVYDRDDL